jgi:hypothetical protein
MASAEIEALRLKKAQLATQSDVLRYNLQLATNDLRVPAQWFERGYDFTVVGLGFWKTSQPWRRARKGKRWRTIPRVVAQLLRWKAAH